MKTETEIAQLWKKLKLERIDFNFSCGGDSMNDTDMEFIVGKNDLLDRNDLNDEDKKIYDEIHDFFDSQIYNEVNFYVNSDGHYMGEQGVVMIELNDDEDSFTYSKDAESEWSERVTKKTSVKLTDEEIAFVKEYVSNINGEERDCNFNYKKDFIMTDKHEELIKNIEEEIIDCAEDFTPEYDGEMQDYFTFSTDNDENSENDVEIEGNNVSLYVSKDFYVFTPSED